MPEVAQPMQAVKVYYNCDECSEPMSSTGMMLASNPAQYPHVCSNNHEKTFWKTYPSVEWREIEIVTGVAE